MKKLYSRIMLKFFLTVIGIVLISAVPALLDGMRLDFLSYISSIGTLFSNLFNPDALVYFASDRENPLFPMLWGKWIYTMELLIAAFLIAFVMSLLLTYGTMLLPKKARDKISFVLTFMESLPDVLIIGIFTIAVLTIYKKTNILFFNIITFGDEHIFVLPIVVLAVLPTLLFYRIMMHDFEDEMGKSYIDLAKARGLNTREILFNHVLRNAIISIFLHSKSILWFMLSNLLVVEYIFNLPGLMFFMFKFYSPMILTIGLLLIFMPIYFMQAMVQILIENTTKRRIEI